MELRRCQDIQISDAGPYRLEARITSLRWKPPKLIVQLLGNLPDAGTVRRLLKFFGRPHVLTLRYEPATLRHRARLCIGDDEVQPHRAESVALLGWQEKIGTSRLWDITLLGPDIDVVVGFKSYAEAHNLAEMLARFMQVPLRESSVVGGSTDYVQPNKRMSQHIFWGVKR